MYNASYEMIPGSSQNIYMCVDALNLDNDQHCVNKHNFPSPLEKLTSAPQMAFRSPGCTMLSAWSALANCK